MHRSGKYLAMENIITIDGPSGAGKSSISRLIAKKMNYLWRDTGKFLMSAKKAMASGNSKIVMNLAKKGLSQAKMAHMQAKAGANPKVMY